MSSQSPADHADGQFFPGLTGEERRFGRKVGYVVAIVVNAIVLYAIHNLLHWGVPFVTPAFSDVLWTFDLSIGATIAANAVYLGYDARWFRDLTQILLTGFAFLVTSTMYGIYPFDFGDYWWNDVARFALLALMVALLIAIVAQLIRLVVESWRETFVA